jgi:hypothetical protein
MVLNRAIPCAEDYDIWSYSCSDCGGSFNMVEPCAVTESVSTSNRRAVPRHDVATAATIGSGRDAIPCMLRNISAVGAELELASHIDIPEYFTLAAQGTHLPSQVIWRKEKRIGIVFL